MPDFVMLAQANGIKGMLVKTREELAGAIAEMLVHEGPVLMDVQVKRDENCYPMVVPGKSNAQMVGLPKQPEPENAIALVSCGNCGAENQPGNKFCPECGTKL